MPRYFFHVRDGENLKLDPEGSDFATLDLAYEEAIASAREIVAQKVMAGEPIDRQQFEITTGDGETVRIVPYRSILNLS